MLKTSKKNSKKMVAVIKNEHSKAEMSQLDDEWANHQGPYLTLEQALELSRNNRQQSTHEKTV